MASIQQYCNKCGTLINLNDTCVVCPLLIECKLCSGNLSSNDHECRYIIAVGCGKKLSSEHLCFCLKCNTTRASQRSQAEGQAEGQGGQGCQAEGQGGQARGKFNTEN